MNVIKCKNGHFFDGDSYDKCPHCGESAVLSGKAAPVKEEKKSFWSRVRKEKPAELQTTGNTPAMPHHEVFGIGSTPTDVLEERISESTPILKKTPTLDFWQTAPQSENESEGTSDGKKEPDSQVNEEVETDADVSVQLEPVPEETFEIDNHVAAVSLREAVKNVSASSEGRTMSYFSSASAALSVHSQGTQTAEPVVGWLVCVGGCHLGQSFTIYVGQNSIGRSEENRIVIPNDNRISRAKHAVVVYEPKKRNFYLQPGDSSGLTYLNEEYITESRKLAARDLIELGESKFLLVPLCGEAFSWEDYMPKGE